MLRLTRQLLISSLLTLSMLSLALGQEVKKDPANETQIITASVTPDGVRIAAPSAVVQLRLEVYDNAGQKLLDTEQRGGNVLDWHLQGSAGERVADGTYLCVVTVKNLSGRVSQKLGLVTVSAESTKLRPAVIAELSPPQAQAVGPIEAEAEGLAMMPAENAESVTVLANDGNQAQLTRTRGALTFRKGDFFSGTDKEQMRLTEEGNLGIGTAKPKAKLDVAGMIRAREGFMFSDGSTLKVNEKGVLTRTASDGADLKSTTATTQNKIAKFTDNLGTVGDSVITESLAGNIGIGTATPQSLLQVGPHPGYGSTTGILITNNLIGSQYDRAFQLAPRQTANPASNSILMYALPTVNTGVTVPSQYGFFVDGKQGPGAITSYAAIATGQTATLGATNNTHLLLGNLGIPAGNFAIYDNTGYKSFFNGNVGIGTTSPGAKLDVAGDAKVSSNLTVDTNALFVDAANDRVGIGTATPTAGLNVKSAFNTRSAVLIENSNNVGGDTASAALWVKNTGLGGLVFRADDTASDTTPFIIDHSGNVGVGTTSPGSKLEVAGNIRLSGANSSLIFPDGTSMITAGGGSAPSGTNIVSAINDPVTAGTINDNRLSGNLAKLNVSNVYNGNQRVNGNVNINDQSNSGLRVQTSINGGTVGSFGGLGNFEIDAPGITGGRLSVKENGNIGIGTNNPTSRLQVAGTVESTAGGFKFPDGSVQPSAANPLVGKVYTNDPNVAPEVEINHDGFVSHISSLNLPPGIYVVTATVQFENRANGLFQDNTRLVKCKLINEYLWHYRLGGANTAMDQITATMHTVLTHNGVGTVWLACGNLESSGSVFAKARRFTAVRVADNPQ